MTGKIPASLDSASSALASPSTSSAIMALPADFVFSDFLSASEIDAVAIEVTVMQVIIVPAIIWKTELTPLV